MEKQNFQKTYKNECISFIKAPFSKRFDVVYVVTSHESWVFCFFKSMKFKTYWHWRNGQITASFHSVQNLLVLKHQVIVEQKLPLCVWQDFESTGMVLRSLSVNLLWKICMKLCWIGKFYLSLLGYSSDACFIWSLFFVWFCAWERGTN